MVETLLNVGANVNEEPGFWEGRTALQAAAQWGRLDVVEILLQAGADVNAPPGDTMGCTALRAAGDKEHFAVVKMLENWGEVRITIAHMKICSLLHCIFYDLYGMFVLEQKLIFFS